MQEDQRRQEDPRSKEGRRDGSRHVLPRSVFCLDPSNFVFERLLCQPSSLFPFPCKISETQIRACSF